MSERRNHGRAPRALLATLALTFLLGAGLAFGYSVYRQGELERDATRDARVLAVEVIQPLLTSADAQTPIHGERYDDILLALRERVLAGPIDRVRLWRSDGTMLFADDPDLVGTREPEMRDDIHATIAGTSQSVVVGERFRTLTSLRIGEPPALIAVELGRSHVGIVEAARDPWYPWAIRGFVAAGVCAALAVAIGLLFALGGALERGVAKRRSTRGVAPKRNRVTDGQRDSDPAYLSPGFQEEVQARRRAEEALEESRRERDALLEHVRRLEQQLGEIRSRDELQPSGVEPAV